MKVTEYLFLSPSNFTPWLLGLLFLLISILWSGWASFRIYNNRPRDLYILDPSRSLILGKWYRNIRFVASAPRMIARASTKANSGPFAIQTLNEYQVLVSSEEHIRDIDKSPPDQLSFYAAMDDRLRFKHTCHGLEQGLDSPDPHGDVPRQTTKRFLRVHLPQLRPRIEASIERGLAAVLDGQVPVQGWRLVSVFSLAENITSRINNQVIVGEELGDDRFHKQALRHSHDALVAMEVCRHLPECLVPFVSACIMGWSGAVKSMGVALRKIVEHRLSSYVETDRPMDCISWVIDSSRTPQQRDTERLVQQMIGLLFAAAHQMPMALAFAIFNLCEHPEYVEPLRKEIVEMLHGPPADYYNNMPLLESFLRECARLNPLDALTTQRKALRDFHFSDGSFVPRGNLIAVAQQVVLQDPAHYSDPLRFDGFRFVTPKHERDHRPTVRFTDTGPSFPFWGSPSKTCAGRWYASAAMKQTMVCLLTKYEFRLVNPNAPKIFTWTTALIPRYDVKLLIRELDM